MADVTRWFQQGLAGQFGATSARRVDWVGDTIKCAFMKDTWTPDQDAEDFWSDINSHECSGTGYTAGGITLSGKAVLVDTAGPLVVSLDAADFDVPDVTLDGANAVARYAFYKDTGSAATSPLIGYTILDPVLPVTAGVFSVAMTAVGILKITVASS